MTFNILLTISGSKFLLTLITYLLTYLQYFAYLLIIPGFPAFPAFPKFSMFIYLFTFARSAAKAHGDGSRMCSPREIFCFWHASVLLRPPLPLLIHTRFMSRSLISELIKLHNEWNLLYFYEVELPR